MSQPEKDRLDRIEMIAQVAGVSISVAHNIEYLRQLERRIVAAAKKNPQINTFHVDNHALEFQLVKLESKR